MSSDPCARCKKDSRQGRSSYCGVCSALIVRESRDRKRKGTQKRYRSVGPRRVRADGTCSRCGRPADRDTSYWCRRCRRDYMLRHTFGVGIDDVERMLAAQGGGCGICGGPHGERWWHVDHCHETGRVRGVLCGSCNRALGLMRDDPTRLRASAAYLERKNS